MLLKPIVGGDGANWVKEGARYINGQFQLARYHLNKELTTALGQDKETKGKVWQACLCGDVETGLRIMAAVIKQAKREQAQRIAKAYCYLRNNSYGIEDYRMKLGEEGKGLRRTGAMEGNVDKLGVRRMKNQGMIIEKKRQVAKWYTEALEDLQKHSGLVLPLEMPWAKNVYWMYSILLSPEFGIARDEFTEKLGKRGIETRPLFYPLHTMPPYQHGGRFPVAEDISQRGLNLPSGFNLDKAEINEICGHISSLFRNQPCK
jgi:hypothetical protein